MVSFYQPIILYSILSSIFINSILVIIFNRYKLLTYLNSFKISFIIGLIFLIISFLFYLNYFFFIIINILIYVLFSFCYVTLINTPESSIRYKIIELIFISESVKINKKRIFDKYNNIFLLETRLNRLLSSNTISIKSDFYIIKNKKIFFIFFFYYYLKKIYKV